MKEPHLSVYFVGSGQQWGELELCHQPDLSGNHDEHVRVTWPCTLTFSFNISRFVLRMKWIMQMKTAHFCKPSLGGSRGASWEEGVVVGWAASQRGLWQWPLSSTHCVWDQWDPCCVRVDETIPDQGTAWWDGSWVVLEEVTKTLGAYCSNLKTWPRVTGAGEKEMEK